MARKSRAMMSVFIRQKAALRGRWLARPMDSTTDSRLGSSRGRCKFVHNGTPPPPPHAIRGVEGPHQRSKSAGKYRYHDVVRVEI